jgi:hypothetical protein
MCALQEDEGVVGHIRDSHCQASSLVLAVTATRRPTSREVKILAAAHLPLPRQPTIEPRHLPQENGQAGGAQLGAQRRVRHQHQLQHC